RSEPSSHRGSVSSHHSCGPVDRRILVGTYLEALSPRARAGAARVRVETSPAVLLRGMTAAERRTERAGGPQTTLGAEVARFRDHLALERRLSAHTVRAYAEDVAQYDRYLVGQGIRSASAVRPRDIESYVASAGWAASTVARKIAALRAFHE